MSTQTQYTFADPSLEQVEYAFRELSYNERLVGYKMTASAGNAVNDMYSLREAVLFLAGITWDTPLLDPGYKGSLNWVDVHLLVEWLNEVVGDTDLATAIAQETFELESYREQSERIAELVVGRMTQYRKVLDSQPVAVAAAS